MTEGARRGRKPRSQTVSAERRRRDDRNFQASQKLAIPEHIKADAEAKGLSLRWVNDEGNRMHQLTKLDDYDKVAGVEPVPVGTAKSGKPIMAHLCAKRTDFIADDQSKRDERRKGIERAMVRGQVPTAPGAEPAPLAGAMGATTYVDKATSIGRGNQIIE